MKSVSKSATKTIVHPSQGQSRKTASLKALGQGHHIIIAELLDSIGGLTTREQRKLLRRTIHEISAKERRARRIRVGAIGRGHPPTAAREKNFSGLLNQASPVSAKLVVANDVNGTFDPKIAEQHYQALGRWKGPLAAPEVQAASKQFWLGLGREGATWLVRRLRTETHVDALHAAGSLLADFGQTAAEPIVEALNSNPAEDQGIVLLKALGWMAEKPSTSRVSRGSLEPVIFLFLNDDVADLREAAARAALLLPPDRAARWLRFRLALEQDEDVRLTICEELDHLGLVGV